MTASSSAAGTERESWLCHVPAPLFAVVMGVCGLGLAWRKAHAVLGVPEAVSDAALAVAASVFLAIAALYAAKAAVHPEAVAAEFAHPIRSNFFPAFSISLLLLSRAALPLWRDAALAAWAAGAAIHLGFTVLLLRRWIVRNHDIHHSNPAWFIPVVGNILVPLTGAPLGFTEISWFCFSIGLGFWVVLFTIVFYRIVFHDQMPAKFMPTLFILIAPPAIGFISYEALTGAIDPFARVLFHFALFLGLLVLSMARQFLAVPFAVSWWAYTFPLDALTIAALEYHERTGAEGLAPVCWIALGATTAVVVLVFLRTLAALIGGKLFVAEA
ncbi:C4-dicarboxylate transporter/malic acid transport protein [uncultured Alphaproteobacteria bacterium]|uniref:C4-dicarboxylate transporter/malic acid transport protein n=1 Tax=uncultured Alphaproteobacteria bacterium TaxID=91750 RepID=A0A212KMD9_9PROT|nr:C4-dicarboxylate transporter/malic acid transport protein [uncultured Alphaproteobacteria bacterium]